MGQIGYRSLIAPCDVGHPWLDMAASIVTKALQDWKTYGQAVDCDIGDPAYGCQIAKWGYGSPQAELISFFCSEWCRWLLGGFNVSYEAMIEELQERGFPKVNAEIIERYLPVLKRYLPLLQFLARKKYGLVIVQLHAGRPAKFGHLPELKAAEEVGGTSEFQDNKLKEECQ